MSFSTYELHVHAPHGPTRTVIVEPNPSDAVHALEHHALLSCDEQDATPLFAREVTLHDRRTGDVSILEVHLM